ncbi:MAG: NADH-quinone oxidoreductase subunit J [Acidobacteriota bacterium]|jgi:NADH-quinone oxidoreductase subunit J|nr:NADH-quinone oxidoreductase subunit J [Acidobacteriota bacterium]NLT31966.1 NADH-quinone oxidoreductase subunit J [Acidobacteriota bacterium]
MLLWVLLGLLVLLAVGACVFRDLLYVAISLALASAVLAGLLFHYGANIAGVFELSVCAGLITVLFVSTVSMTKDSDQGKETRMGRGFIPLFLLVFIGLDIFIVRWLAGALPEIVPGAGSGSFQDIFWTLRSADILGQVVLILAGVFGISALFRLKAKEKKHE